MCGPGVTCFTLQDVPDDFVDALTVDIRSQAYSPNDEIVRQGKYGNSLCIVLTGQVAICENGIKRRLIMCDDDEPIFGMSAVLDQATFEASRANVDTWSAEAITYCHVAELGHDSITVALAATWPSGEERMHRIARQVRALAHAPAESPSARPPRACVVLAKTGDVARLTHGPAC